jgi:hypothetical protein
MNESKIRNYIPREQGFIAIYDPDIVTGHELMRISAD